MKITTLCAFCISIIFWVGPVNGDEKVIGHMAPFTEERLSSTIELDCGVSIVENKDKRKLPVDRINNLCLEAVNSFPDFLRAKDINIDTSEPFYWFLSFLPEKNCYRCLNDLTYRFSERQFQADVIGYTDKNSQYSFVFDDASDSEFKPTVIHELFHAQSMFYGLYDSHSEDDVEKAQEDEVLADEFTNWILNVQK